MASPTMADPNMLVQNLTDILNTDGQELKIYGEIYD